ncbi:hypothetical protein GCM10009546_20580 [Actinomadura livida]|uniref:Uncharacterized protein n=1 Tax=Actinomadura livida TaxID=79909 RepID=A0ABN1E5B0_9ACTN|nr:hypothetical protein GCM10010208_02440 [Actinomadura livida]
MATPIATTSTADSASSSHTHRAGRPRFIEPPAIIRPPAAPAENRSAPGPVAIRATMKHRKSRPCPRRLRRADGRFWSLPNSPRPRARQHRP